MEGLGQKPNGEAATTPSSPTTTFFHLLNMPSWEGRGGDWGPTLQPWLAWSSHSSMPQPSKCWH